MDDNISIVLSFMRVFAALTVITTHISGLLKGVPHFVSLLFYASPYGVSLFFILSGFLAVPSVKKSSGYKQYLVKRYIRIAPLYYICLGMTFIVGVFITKDYPLDIKWLYHLVFLNMFLFEKEWQWWNAVQYFWTIPLFMAWYVVSPWLLRWCKTMKKTALMTLFVALFSVLYKHLMYNLASQQFVNWNFFSLLYTFFFGVLAYRVVEERSFLIGGGYVVLIFIVSFICGNHSGFLIMSTFFYLMLLCLIYLAELIHLDEYVSKGSVHLLKVLSESTFCTYLTHWFIRQGLKALLLITPPISWVLIYAVSICLCFLLGIGTHYCIELPLSAYFNRLLSKRSSCD